MCKNCYSLLSKIKTMFWSNQTIILGYGADIIEVLIKLTDIMLKKKLKVNLICKMKQV